MPVSTGLDQEITLGNRGLANLYWRTHAEARGVRRGSGDVPLLALSGKGFQARSGLVPGMLSCMHHLVKHPQLLLHYLCGPLDRG